MLAFAIAVTLALQTERIEWAKDLETAMAASARDGRPVLAYLTYET